MLVATSTRALWGETGLYPGVLEMLTRLRALVPVAVVSNQAKPAWFDGLVGAAGVGFATIQGRQGGEAVRKWAQDSNVPAHQVLVLGANREDVAMAKNAGAVLLSCGWAADSAASGVGLAVSEPDEVDDIARLVREWGGQVYCHAEGPTYSVRALCDASSHRFVDDEQRRFGERVAEAVKHGTTRLNKLLAATTGSLMRVGMSEVKDLRWGVYPSSAVLEADGEVLSDFTHRLRTTVSRVQFARQGEPLFVRHRRAPKRSAGEGGDRNDATAEVESLHLNPFYRSNSRLAGKNIVVVDDLTTYGLSMGVAAGFLRRAGAASVQGLAVGKLGNRLSCFDVRITGNPFAPVGRGEWECSLVDWVNQTYSEEDQTALRTVLEL